MMSPTVMKAQKTETKQKVVQCFDETSIDLIECRL